MVVWIEIYSGPSRKMLIFVTTCVVVWIEILSPSASSYIGVVTTCVVVWIEIYISVRHATGTISHHLRGGVD